MNDKILLDKDLFDITIHRLCSQLVEKHNDFSNSVIIGIQSSGVFLADKIQNILSDKYNIKIDVGYLDITFHRDDFRTRKVVADTKETKIDFIIENKNVILVDDVLYTGRSTRAALDAMISYGRPQKVELLVLIDRLLSRDLPIEAKYIGRKVHTLPSQFVEVAFDTNGNDHKIFLIDKTV